MRTWNLLTRFVDPKTIYAADIGTGQGTLTRRLKAAGAAVLAIDTSENALQLLKKKDPGIDILQGTMPLIPISDRTFDVVLCTDVIAELSPKDYRLFFSELSRLVKPAGYVLCSTPIDYTTEGGAERFIDLAQSEFLILSCMHSYHALYLRIKRCFEAPGNYVKARKDIHLRNNESNKRNGFRKYLYKVLTSNLFFPLWRALQCITDPVASFIRRSPKILSVTEKICRKLSGESGISHAMFLAKIRPLDRELPRDEIIRRPEKKQIWE